MATKITPGEKLLAELHDKLAELLLEKARAKDITPAEMKVALDLCKHNSVYGGDVSRKDNPVTELLHDLPFTSVDEELPSRPIQ